MDKWLDVASAAVTSHTDVQQPRAVGCYAKKDGAVKYKAEAMSCLGKGL